MKIAPYVAQSVSRSYLRQQRVGDRIAQVRSGAETPQRPDTRIELSEAARRVAETAARRSAAEAREEELNRLSERFSDQIMAAADQGKSPQEKTALGRVLDALGLALEGDESGGGKRIIRKDTGELLAVLTPEARETVGAEIRKLAGEVLSGLL